uniref:Uncharacterized protein n=1 Tax=Trieres chinensis TaxID=1514140 RepID=A0A7S2A8I3_TRICV|mmetsp:Transcript_7005/g.14696  ORF Transcript_7005/g.14696 Transcript_7005/m.14696 type:complete len:275 (+) Transcript_7005:574-1398(+)
MKIQSRLRAEASQMAQGLSRTGRIMSDRSKKREITDQDKTQVQNHPAQVRKNRKLLLRPNTTFSVTWKAITVACVALEVASIAFAPVLSGEMKKMSLDSMIKVALLPPKKDYNLPSTGLLRPLLGTIFSDSISFIAHTRKDHDPFWKKVWKSVVQYLADQTALLASVISFLDVFITFFTGELSEQTGVLRPKKFFKRWILPGVLLQLLVNPNMKDVAGIIKNSIQFSFNVGLARLCHIFIAVLPIISFITVSFLDVIHEFVERENKKISASFLA